MRIHLRQLDGSIASIDVHPTATFGSLKSTIAQAARLGAEGVALVFDGVAQADGVRFLDACVTEQTALTVVIGGGSVFIDDLGSALAPSPIGGFAAGSAAADLRPAPAHAKASNRDGLKAPLASLTAALVDSLTGIAVASSGSSVSRPAALRLRDDDLLPLDAVTAMDAVPRLHLLLPSGAAVAVDLSSGGGGDSGSDAGSRRSSEDAVAGSGSAAAAAAAAAAAGAGSPSPSRPASGPAPALRLRDMHPIRHLRAAAAAAAGLPLARTGLVLRGRAVPRSLDASAAIGQLGLSPAGDTVIHVVYAPRRCRSGQARAQAQARAAAVAAAAAAAAGEGSGAAESEGDLADNDDDDVDDESEDEGDAQTAASEAAATPTGAAACVFDGKHAVAPAAAAAAAVAALVAASSSAVAGSAPDAAAHGSSGSSSHAHAHILIPADAAALLSLIGGPSGSPSADCPYGTRGPAPARGGRLHAHCPCCGVAGAHFSVVPMCPVCLCRAAEGSGSGSNGSPPSSSAAAAALSTVLLSGSLPPGDADAAADSTGADSSTSAYSWRQLLEARVACVRCGYAGPPEVGFTCRAVAIADSVAGAGTGTAVVFPSVLDVPPAAMRAAMSRQAAAAFGAGLLPGGGSGAAAAAGASASSASCAVRPCPSGPVTVTALLPLLRAARSAPSAAALELSLPDASAESASGALDPRVAQSLALSAPAASAGGSVDDDPLAVAAPPSLAFSAAAAAGSREWSSALGPSFASFAAAATTAGITGSAPSPLALAMDPEARATRLLAQVHALLAVPASGGLADTTAGLAAAAAGM